MLHHVEIYVSDLAASFAFWSWLLGRLDYTKTSEWEAGFTFRKGDAYFTFVQTEPQHLDVPYHRCKVGLNHLAFGVPTAADVDAMLAALVEKKIPTLYSERYPYASGEDFYAVFFEDPDRIKVEVVALT